jgi:hypothetical protein
MKGLKKPIFGPPQSKLSPLLISLKLDFVVVVFCLLVYAKADPSFSPDRFLIIKNEILLRHLESCSKL